MEDGLVDDQDSRGPGARDSSEISKNKNTLDEGKHVMISRHHIAPMDEKIGPEKQIILSGALHYLRVLCLRI